MGSLERRLQNLEAEFGGGGCLECGAGRPGPVTFVMGKPLEAGEEFEQEYCGTCGEPTNCTLQLFHPSGADPLRDELNELLEEEVDERPRYES